MKPPCSGLTEVFFPDEGGSYALARIICAGCPYKQRCFELGEHEFHGMWGGTSPRERRAMAA